MKLPPTFLSPERAQRIAQLALLGVLVLSVLWRGGKSLDTTWLLLGVAWLCTMQYWWSQPRRSCHLPSWLWAAAVAYVLWTTLSFVGSSTANYGLDEVLRTAGGIFLFFYVARMMVPDEQPENHTHLTFIEILLRFLVYTTILACLIGCLVYIFQPVERFVGTFFDHRFHTDYWPNAWAQYLLLTWPLVVWWAKRATAEWHQRGPAVIQKLGQSAWFDDLIQIVIVGFVLGCLLLSYSRAAMIAFFGQLIVWAGLTLWRERPERRTLLRRATRSVIVFLMAASVFSGLNDVRSQFYPVQSVEEKVTFTAPEGTSSISEREQFWGQAKHLASQQPILGWGPYSFRFVQPQLQQHVLATSDHPHNVWLKLAMERGVVAAVLFTVVVLGVVGMFTRTLVYSFKSASQPASQQSSLYVLILIGLIGVLAHNLVDYNLQFVGIILPFWLLLGILASQLQRTDHGVPRRLQKGLEVLLLTVLMVVAVIEARYLLVSAFGRHAEARGDRASALLWYERAERQKFSRDMHLSRTHLLLQSDEPAAAQTALGQYFAQNAHDGRAWKLQGDVCAAQKDWVCALESYERAYDLNRYNDLSAVRAFIAMLKSTGQRAVIDARRREFEELMNDYGLAVNQNAHYIALSANAEELVELTNIFASLYPDDEPQYVVLGANVVRKMEEERGRMHARPPGFLW